LRTHEETRQEAGLRRYTRRMATGKEEPQGGRRIGVLTGGGDAPGLNAVIRAVVKSAANCGSEVIGLEDSFDGLIRPGRLRRLTPRDVTGILRIGGTILGTTNRGNPFRYPEDDGGTRDY